MLHNSCQRGVRICERNNPADTKDNEEGRGGGASGARAEIPLQPVEKTMVKHVVLLQPMGVHGGADIHPDSFRRLFSWNTSSNYKLFLVRGGNKQIMLFGFDLLKCQQTILMLFVDVSDECGFLVSSGIP